MGLPILSCPTLNYDYESGELLTTDSTHRMTLVTNKDGDPLRQFATQTFFSRTPTDIVYILPAGNYAVSDSYHDEIFIVNSIGFKEMSFDTYNFGATTPNGVAFDPVSGYIFVVDDGSDMVYILDIPKVLEATTVTGTFTGAIQGIPSTFRLREVAYRSVNEGFLSGELERGAATYVAPGFRTGSSVIIDFLNTPLGHKTLAGSVSGDFNTITFPAPVGVLSR